MIGLLVEALSGIKAPDQRILVNIGDRPRRERLLPPWRIFGPGKAEGFRDIAAPDFVFGGWPETGVGDFDATCARIAAAGAVPSETDLMGWYGNVGMHAKTRGALMGIGMQIPERVQAVDVGSWYRGSARIGVPGGLPDLAEQTRRFRYLIDVEGNGYSGRLKLLLHSGRVVFIQDYPWREWFREHLVPWQHYVPVARDLSDLIERLEQVRADPDMEKRIAENGCRFAQEHLTRQKAVEVWRSLLCIPGR